MQENRILKCLAAQRNAFLIHKEQLQYEHLQEIKLRVEKPLLHDLQRRRTDPGRAARQAL